MSGLRVVVAGLAGTFPYGGVFWDYLQYPLGLHRLGHDVLYLEDGRRWCYDPVAATFVKDGARNAARLGRWIGALEPPLARRWFMRDAAGTGYGMPWWKVAEFCRSADLFLHLSASCWMRDEYWAAKRVAFVDSDPMYTQASVPDYVAGRIDDEARARVEMIGAHDVLFTFGERVGAPGCSVPTGPFRWLPTRQPVVLDAFRDHAVPVPERRRVLTTVGSWVPARRVELVVDGVAYGSKGTELERFLDLPARSALPLELALSGQLSKRRLRAHGWRLVAANAVSDSPWSYRRHLARSLGEWSVAKSPYVASRSGWFSCRSACYLALGVPVVVQDTGFADRIPTGEGVLAFETLEQAAEAIERLAAEPARHARAAREIARECFDSAGVLTRLLEDAFSPYGSLSPVRHPEAGRHAHPRGR